VSERKTAPEFRGGHRFGDEDMRKDDAGAGGASAAGEAAGHRILRHRRSGGLWRRSPVMYRTVP
jgi:hypothetical protein